MHENVLPPTGLVKNPTSSSMHSYPGFGRKYQSSEVTSHSPASTPHDAPHKHHLVQRLITTT